MHVFAIYLELNVISFYFALVFTVTKNQMKDERGNAWAKLFLSRKFTAEKFDLKTA